MKLIRIQDDHGQVNWARIRPFGRRVEWLRGDPYSGNLEPTGELGSGEFLAPVRPTAIIGIAQNYRHHAAEMGKPEPERPIFFTKFPTCVQHPDAPILLPTAAGSTQVDYEGELAVVLGRDCQDVTREEALSYVLGYTCANDVSARDWQYQWSGGQYNRAKSFATFCPLGPVLLTADEVPDPADFHLRTLLNGEVVQESSLDDLIFDVPALISFLSQSTCLPAGTVILTGTPAGVGHARTPPRYLQRGDTIQVEISRIGTLSNYVA